ncbi:MAG: secretin N-terminal domain-containing protein, partial [Planctomycetota bacterium]
MSAFKGRGRLLLVAMPVGLAVALLAAFLPAGGDVASQDTTRPETNRQARSEWTRSPSESFRLAQAATNPAVGSEALAPVKPGSTPSAPTLTVYQCASGNAQAVAAQLEQQFKGNPGVRIVPDGRTSQILVMAPPEVQSQIAGRLPEAPTTGVTAAPAVSPGLPPAPLPQRPSAQDIQLWHTTGAQFEAALVRVLGDRLTPAVSSIPGESAYQLSLAGGHSLRISIDRPLNRVKIQGAGDALVSAGQLIHALDSPDPSVERSMRLVALSGKRSADVRRVVDAIRSGQTAQTSGGAAAPTGQNTWRLAMTSQAADQASSAPSAPAAADATPGTTPPAEQPPPDPGAAAVPAPEGLGGEGGMIGSVQIEILPGDILVIRGHERDVQAVVKLIEQIEQISEPPAIEVYHLQHAHCASLATLLNKLYEDVYSARQGKVSITALGKPNAVLLIGQQESVDTVVDLIKRLDRPVPASTQFEVFHLKSTPAEDAKETLDEFFEDRYEDDEAGLGTRVLVTADFRTNSLLVWASPRDMSEIAAIVARLDGEESESFNSVQIFKLKNSLAEDLAPVLQDAITGQMYGQRTGQRTLFQGAGTGERFERKSVRLQFVTIDENGQTRLNSGLLTDAQVTADTRANALIVTASADSMPLIAALIWELDRLPTAEAQVKVFTVVHGDASNLLEMLDDLFGAQTQGADLAVRTGAAGEDSSLVFLRFAVDVRTNSIIATGSEGDLVVVESILATLDTTDLRERQTVVMRLKNAAAPNVSEAVNSFLEMELDAQQPTEGLLSSIEQIDREVVIVPEEITNSLIISATERYFSRITELVEKLDARPPMVLIQVLIASVRLNETDEFGIELGLQDSILFDRSVAGIPGF